MITRAIWPFLASVTGMTASVEAGAVPEPGTLDALGRWPVTVVLGAVCVVCVYFMYRQSKENADRNSASQLASNKALLEMVSGERAATEHRIISNATATKELADNNARVVKELAENNAKVVKDLADNHAQNLRTLLDEISKQSSKVREP